MITIGLYVIFFLQYQELVAKLIVIAFLVTQKLLLQVPLFQHVQKMENTILFNANGALNAGVYTRMEKRFQTHDRWVDQLALFFLLLVKFSVLNYNYSYN